LVERVFGREGEDLSKGHGLKQFYRQARQNRWVLFVLLEDSRESREEAWNQRRNVRVCEALSVICRVKFGRTGMHWIIDYCTRKLKLDVVEELCIQVDIRVRYEFIEVLIELLKPGHGYCLHGLRRPCWENSDGYRRKPG